MGEGRAAGARSSAGRADPPPPYTNKDQLRGQTSPPGPALPAPASRRSGWRGGEQGGLGWGPEAGRPQAPGAGPQASPTLPFTREPLREAAAPADDAPSPDLGPGSWGPPVVGWGRWAPGPVALPQARVEGTGGWIGGRRRRRRGGGEEEEEGEKEGGGRKVAGRGRGGGEEGKARRRTRRKAGRQRRPVTGTSAAAARGRRDRSRGCAPERDFTTNPVCKLLFIFRKVCQTWALIFRPDFPLVARSRTRSHIIYDCLWS